MFQDLLNKLSETVRGGDFTVATQGLISFVERIPLPNFFHILENIGSIPESIAHDSTEEKLYSKVSDAVLARTLREIGLKATVLTERADSADVIVQSKFHGYTLVADAKAFRMSRTAKNQKDFKVTALSGWRQENDYAVLCAPYFQYPNRASQIYAQALLENVCLLSWEHLLFMIQNGIKETAGLNLCELWNFTAQYANTCTVTERKSCFTAQFNSELMRMARRSADEFGQFLNRQIDLHKKRGDFEKKFWVDEIAKIKQYTREQAIEELITAKKIDAKIWHIDEFVRRLKI